jgi:hypothetical protein
MHWPMPQVYVLPSHRLPHPPQLSGSEEGSMQAPLQHICVVPTPLMHGGKQVPPSSPPSEPPPPLEPLLDPLLEPLEPPLDPLLEPLEPLLDPLLEPLEPPLDPLLEPLEPLLDPLLEPLELLDPPLELPLDPLPEEEPLDDSIDASIPAPGELLPVPPQWAASATNEATPRGTSIFEKVRIAASRRAVIPSSVPCRSRSSPSSMGGTGSSGVWGRAGWGSSTRRGTSARDGGWRSR